MIYAHFSYWFLALLLSICGATFQQFCDENNPPVGNTSDHTKLAQLLKESMDEQVHPCDDFYQFACGRFNRKATEEDHWRTKLEAQGIQTFMGLLTLENVSFPKAFEIAQLCYKSCLQSNQQWEEIGGTVQFVLRKIRDFGRFPLIDDGYSDSEESNYTVDLTDLLVHYNVNRTTTYFLVPSIVFTDLNDTRLKAVTHSQTRKTIASGRTGG